MNRRSGRYAALTHRGPVVLFALERRVSQVDSFRQIAFFHHLILRKEG